MFGAGLEARIRGDHPQRGPEQRVRSLQELLQTHDVSTICLLDSAGSHKELEWVKVLRVILN